MISAENYKQLYKKSAQLFWTCITSPPILDSVMFVTKFDFDDVNATWEKILTSTSLKNYFEQCFKLIESGGKIPRKS